MTNKLFTLMPHFARHEGRWVGSHLFTTPSGAFVDRYDIEMKSEFPDDGSCDYRLSALIMWPDGREKSGIYEGHYRDGRLWFEGELNGYLRELDSMTMYGHMTMGPDGIIDIYSMQQISEDGSRRMRSWHWFNNNQPFQITIAEERRWTDPLTAMSLKSAAVES